MSLVSLFGKITPYIMYRMTWEGSSLYKLSTHYFSLTASVWRDSKGDWGDKRTDFPRERQEESAHIMLQFAREVYRGSYRVRVKVLFILLFFEKRRTVLKQIFCLLIPQRVSQVSISEIAQSLRIEETTHPTMRMTVTLRVNLCWKRSVMSSLRDVFFRELKCQGIRKENETLAVRHTVSQSLWQRYYIWY